MSSEIEIKATELDRLYDIFWQSSSELDRALLKTKIRMVAAELDRMEMTGALISRSDKS